MAKLTADLLPELLGLLGFGVGTGALSTLGVYIELLAMGALSTGDVRFGLWLTLAGAVALYFGVYAMGITEFVPRLRALLGRTTA